MGKTNQYTIEMLPHTSEYFLNGTDTSKLFDLINLQEMPIRVYNGCEFRDILIIDKKENNYKFLKDSLPENDKKAISDMSETLIKMFPIDGIWLYDLKHNKVIYDYVKNERFDDWRFFKRGATEQTTLLCLDGAESTPIKLYNTQNKQALLWGIYYVNRYLTNPFEMLEVEFGTERMLDLVSNVFNLDKFNNFSYNKTDTLCAISVFEKMNNSDIDLELLTRFNKIYSKQKINVNEEEIKKEDESEKKAPTVSGLILSKKGKAHLSDLLKAKIPEDEFIPIELDIVTDPRILSAHVENGLIFFASSVQIEQKTKDRIIALFSEPNRKFVDVKTMRQLDSYFSLRDQYEWYDEMNRKGGFN